MTPFPQFKCSILGGKETFQCKKRAMSAGHTSHLTIHFILAYECVSTSLIMCVRMVESTYINASVPLIVMLGCLRVGGKDE